MPWIPPLAAVRVFEAAARHENFGAAAKELGMTQAGVSYQIKVLEERLGAQLFARKGRNVTLTAFGHRISPRVSEAFVTLSDAFATVREENEAVLEVSASTTFATQWLAARLGRFHLAHPGIAVRLDVSDRTVDLAAGEADVAIRGIADPGPGLVSHFIMRQPVVPMASPALIERIPLGSEAQIAAAPRVSPADEWWGLWFGDAPGAEPARIQDTIRFDSQVLDGQAALAGQGVVMMSPPMFAREIAAGQLVPLSDRFAYDRRSFWFCYAKPKRRLAKVRAFRDWLLDEVASEFANDRYGALVPPDEGASFSA